MDYLASIATLAAIYAILSMSLGLILGQLGIFTMAHAAIFGVGAYGYAVATVTFGVNPWLAALIGIVLGAALGALISVPALRVKGEYFLVVSFAVQLIFTTIFKSWESVTRGVSGLPGVPRAEIPGLDMFDPLTFAVICLVVAAIAGVLIWVFTRTPYALTMHAVRDDETLARAFGMSVPLAKLSVSALSGVFAGLAGVLYAQYIMFLNPTVFTVSTSMAVITMAVLGGMRSVVGTAIGAVLITALPQVLEAFRISSDVAGPVQQIIFGVFLVFVMFVRPGGIMRGNDLRKYERKEVTAK